MERLYLTVPDLVTSLRSGNVRALETGALAAADGRALAVRAFVPGAAQSRALPGGGSTRVNDDGSMTFRISTPELDRFQTTFALAGWRTKNFAVDPVVLWMHNKRADLLPVAKSTLPEVRADGLYARALWVPRELSEHADQIRRFYEAGYLNAASQSFDPIRARARADGGIDFLEQDLLEWSCVCVPGTPGALAAARSAGLDVRPIRAALAWELDGAIAPAAPRDVLEAAAFELGRAFAVPRGFECDPNAKGATAVPNTRDLNVGYMFERAIWRLSGVATSATRYLADPACRGELIGECRDAGWTLEAVVGVLSALERADGIPLVAAARDACETCAAAGMKGECAAEATAARDACRAAAPVLIREDMSLPDARDGAPAGGTRDAGDGDNTRAGRVLSGANEAKIREAIAALVAVLDSMPETERSEPETSLETERAAAPLTAEAVRAALAAQLGENATDRR